MVKHDLVYDNGIRMLRKSPHPDMHGPDFVDYGEGMDDIQQMMSKFMQMGVSI